MNWMHNLMQKLLWAWDCLWEFMVLNNANKFDLCELCCWWTRYCIQNSGQYCITVLDTTPSMLPHRNKFTQPLSPFFLKPLETTSFSITPRVPSFSSPLPHYSLDTHSLIPSPYSIYHRLLLPPWQYAFISPSTLLIHTLKLNPLWDAAIVFYVNTWVPGLRRQSPLQTGQAGSITTSTFNQRWRLGGPGTFQGVGGSGITLAGTRIAVGGLQSGVLTHIEQVHFLNLFITCSYCYQRR